MRVPFVTVMAVMCVSACENRAAREARLAAAARVRVEATAAEASVAASGPARYVWDAGQLTKRLADAGLAPQRLDTVRAKPWMGVPVVAFRLGDARLDAYVYHDSIAARTVADRLDAATLAPPGTESPWAKPHELARNGNLLGIVVGGTDRQRERITTALAAGAGPP